MAVLFVTLGAGLFPHVWAFYPGVYYPGAYYSGATRNAVIAGTPAHPAAAIRVIGRPAAGVFEPQDLVHKRIATTVASAAHYYLDGFLLAHGVDVDATTLVHLSPGETVKAFVAGEVDAMALPEPFAQRALQILGDEAVPL